MRKEIRISGFGGQGVVLAGYVLGKALTLYDGFEAVMTQAYGPEARGGASSANLVVSDEPIDYPIVEHPDILVALSQEAYNKFRPTATSDALILIDEELVDPFLEDDAYRIPASRLAEELGRRLVANVVMLGFFTAVTRLVGQTAMQQAIQTSVKAKAVPLNLQAFAKGYAYALAAASNSQYGSSGGSERSLPSVASGRAADYAGATHGARAAAAVPEEQMR